MAVRENSKDLSLICKYFNLKVDSDFKPYGADLLRLIHILEGWECRCHNGISRESMPIVLHTKGLFPTFTSHNDVVIEYILHHFKDIYAWMKNTGIYAPLDINKMFIDMHKMTIVEDSDKINGVTRYLAFGNCNLLYRIENSPIGLISDCWTDLRSVPLTDERVKKRKFDELCINTLALQILNTNITSENKVKLNRILAMYCLTLRETLDAAGRLNLESKLNEKRESASDLLEFIYYMLTGFHPLDILKVLRENRDMSNFEMYESSPTFKKFMAKWRNLVKYGDKKEMENMYLTYNSEFQLFVHRASEVLNANFAINNDISEIITNLPDDTVCHYRNKSVRAVVKNTDILTSSRNSLRSGTYLGIKKTYHASGFNQNIKINLTTQYDPAIYYKGKVQDFVRVSKNIMTEKMMLWVFSDLTSFKVDSVIDSSSTILSTNINTLIQNAGSELYGSFNFGVGIKANYDGMLAHLVQSHGRKLFMPNLDMIGFVVAFRRSGCNALVEFRDRLILDGKNKINLTIPLMQPDWDRMSTNALNSTNPIGKLTVIEIVLCNILENLQDMGESNCLVCYGAVIRLFERIYFDTHGLSFMLKFDTMNVDKTKKSDGSILSYLSLLFEMSALKLRISGSIIDGNLISDDIEAKINHMRIPDNQMYCDKSIMAARAMECIEKSVFGRQSNAEVVALSDDNRSLSCDILTTYDVQRTAFVAGANAFSSWVELIKYGVTNITVQVSEFKKVNSKPYIINLHLPLLDLFICPNPTAGVYYLSKILSKHVFAKHSMGYLPTMTPIVHNNGISTKINSEIVRSTLIKRKDIFDSLLRDHVGKLTIHANLSGGSFVIKGDKEIFEAVFNEDNMVNFFSHVLPTVEVTVNDYQDKHDMITLLTNDIMNATKDNFRDCTEVSVAWEFKFLSIIVYIPPVSKIFTNTSIEEGSVFIPISTVPKVLI